MIIHKAIANKEHLVKVDGSGVLRADIKYLCNQAVTPNKKKVRFQWKYVTCKNCLQQKPIVKSKQEDKNVH